LGRGGPSILMGVHVIPRDLLEIGIERVLRELRRAREGQWNRASRGFSVDQHEVLGDHVVWERDVAARRLVRADDARHDRVADEVRAEHAGLAPDDEEVERAAGTVGVEAVVRVAVDLPSAVLASAADVAPADVLAARLHFVVEAVGDDVEPLAGGRVLAGRAPGVNASHDADVRVDAPEERCRPSLEPPSLRAVLEEDGERVARSRHARISPRKRRRPRDG